MNESLTRNSRYFYLFSRCLDMLLYCKDELKLKFFFQIPIVDDRSFETCMDIGRAENVSDFCLNYPFFRFCRITRILRLLQIFPGPFNFGFFEFNCMYILSYL